MKLTITADTKVELGSNWGPSSPAFYLSVGDYTSLLISNGHRNLENYRKLLTHMVDCVKSKEGYRDSGGGMYLVGGQHFALRTWDRHVQVCETSEFAWEVFTLHCFGDTEKQIEGKIYRMNKLIKALQYRQIWVS